MAYTINSTNGSVIATVADGTLNTTTDLTFFGKNYSGYGEILHENFVKLLENFSNTTQPSSPLSGQLWWDQSNSLLKVYTGSTFKVISGSTASSTQPSSATSGDLWFDTTNGQLYVYSGSSWTLIGPSFTSLTGTSGAIVETVADNLGSNHVVVKLYVSNTILAIISKDSTFTPQSAISGFATIGPGLQMSSAVSNAVFNGNATNSQTLDGLDSTQFIRSDTNDTTSGILTVSNDGGVIVGTDNDLQLTVSGINTLISNATSDGDILIRVNKSSGGVTTAALVDGATANVTFAADVTATNFVGTASSAKYADLAERFESDVSYEPGTVVSLGGSAEITAVNEELSNDVFGVISTQAAYLMNSTAGNDETHPPVAMTGRVPVRVTGKVNKGDRLVSAGNGIARAALPDEITSFNVIGRALTTKTSSGTGMVTAVVKVN